MRDACAAFATGVVEQFEHQMGVLSRGQTYYQIVVVQQVRSVYKQMNLAGHTL